MNISNFRYLCQINGYEYATIDVVTYPYLFKKVTETKAIYQEPHSDKWRLSDTGQFTPGYICEDLFSAFKAEENKNGLETE